MDKKWYTITTITGKEMKVVENLKNRVINEKIEEIEDFKIMLVPYLTAREQQKKDEGNAFKVREKNLYPGYIFLKMDMTNDAWFIVRNTQYVTGLVGSSGSRTKPTPVSLKQMVKMEKRVIKMTDEFNAGKTMIDAFKIGDLVEVKDNEMKGQVGNVVEVNNDSEKALVEIIMFNKKTPTWFAFKNLKIKK